MATLLTCQNLLMRVLLQRVTEAVVTVDGAIVGQIEDGMLALVAIEEADTPQDVTAAVSKIVALRVFGDEAGKMNLSVADIGGSVLVVSQFTLVGDARKGRRPSFVAAAGPAHAKAMVDRLVAEIEGHGIGTAQGEFGRRMRVRLVNDGPVTLMLDIRDGRVV
jgi:D-tyrosyl-tRNA(Tyr) deacylase